MAQNSYQTINLNSSITLSWPFSFQGGPVIADINNVSTSQIQMACYAATTGNLVAIYNNGISGVGATLTNNDTLVAFSVDTVSPSMGARILVKNQTPLSNTNGIYTLTTVGDGSTPWVLTRAIDYDTPSEIRKGDFILVTNGTVNANTRWIQTANIISVGISSPNFIMQNNGWTITLPDATLATPGQNVQFNNIGLFPFQILANDGITNIANVLPGDLYFLYLNDNSTPNGGWNPVRLTNGSSSINSVVATSSDSSINITGGTLAPPGGTMNFQLPASIFNLTNVTTPGFIAATATNPLTFASRTLTSDTNISITNGDGKSTNPMISLNPSGLSGIASIAPGNLQLSGNTITTNITNGNVQLNGNGTGVVQINKTVQVDPSGNITGANNLTLAGSLTIGGAFITPNSPKVIFTFTDTLLGGITKLSYYNVSTITGNGGQYTITFPSLSSSNYGITFGLGGAPGPNIDSDPVITNVVWENKTTTSVSIKIYDIAGVLAQSVPYGVTGVIWLPS